VLSGISPPFGGLFLTEGQITHALLTRAPLYSSAEADFLVRLACVRHAASVCSEPGSNSPVFILDILINLNNSKRTQKSSFPVFNCQRPLKRAYTFSLKAFSCQELFERKIFPFRYRKELIILDSIHMSSKNFNFFKWACEIVPRIKTGASVRQCGSTSSCLFSKESHRWP
jgi:hypothetical protein